MNGLPESVLRGVRRSTSQRLNDEAAILHCLLVDPSLTTARTRLEPRHFADPEHAKIFEAIRAAENEGRPRADMDVRAILKRFNGTAPQALRQILKTDTTFYMLHFAWNCAELREAADQAEELRAAIQILQKHSH